MLCRACSKVTAGVPDGRRPRRRGSLSVTVRSGTLRDDPMAAGRIRRAHGPGRHGPRVRRITERLIPMCRNIKRLRHADHPPTDGELHDAPLQFVRKISGFHAPSKANAAAFDVAVRDVAASGLVRVGALERLAPGEATALPPRG